MIDLAAITAGLTGTSQLTVGPEHTAPFVGSGRIPVLATPVMINVIETAALNAVEHLLPAGHQSLGTHLNVSHVAATPVGLTGHRNRHSFGRGRPHCHVRGRSTR
jgi:predicted thioesterase